MQFGLVFSMFILDYQQFVISVSVRHIIDFI